VRPPNEDAPSASEEVAPQPHGETVPSRQTESPGDSIGSDTASFPGSRQSLLPHRSHRQALKPASDREGSRFNLTQRSRTVQFTRSSNLKSPSPPRPLRSPSPSPSHAQSHHLTSRSGGTQQTFFADSDLWRWDAFKSTHEQLLVKLRDERELRDQIRELRIKVRSSASLSRTESRSTDSSGAPTSIELGEEDLRMLEGLESELDILNDAVSLVVHDLLGYGPIVVKDMERQLPGLLNRGQVAFPGQIYATSSRSSVDPEDDLDPEARPFIRKQDEIDALENDILGLREELEAEEERIQSLLEENPAELGQHLEQARRLEFNLESAQTRLKLLMADLDRLRDLPSDSAGYTGSDHGAVDQT
jgi:hypothetical protein